MERSHIIRLTPGSQSTLLNIMLLGYWREYWVKGGSTVSGVLTPETSQAFTQYCGTRQALRTQLDRY
jgi:hypothetical protein